MERDSQQGNRMKDFCDQIACSQQSDVAEYGSFQLLRSRLAIKIETARPVKLLFKCSITEVWALKSFIRLPSDSQPQAEEPV
jgi:hypothetical protein